MAVSLVTWSASAMRRGIGPKGIPRKSWSRPGHQHLLAGIGQARDDLGQPLVEELPLLDRHDVGVADERLDLARVTDRHGDVLRPGAGDDGALRGPRVEPRLDQYHAAPRDRKAAQEAQHLVGLAAEHASADHVHPAGRVEHPGP